eukprot:8562928-Pyramimonas_sp.AAC.1
MRPPPWRPLVYEGRARAQRYCGVVELLRGRPRGRLCCSSPLGDGEGTGGASGKAGEINRRAPPQASPSPRLLLLSS